MQYYTRLGDGIYSGPVIVGERAEASRFFLSQLGRIRRVNAHKRIGHVKQILTKTDRRCIVKNLLKFRRNSKS